MKIHIIKAVIIKFYDLILNNTQGEQLVQQNNCECSARK